MKEAPYDLIYVEWDDAVGNSNWFGRDMAKAWIENTQYIISETGFLVDEDKHAIYLAGFWKPKDSWVEEQLGNLRRIPKNWIKTRKNLTKHL